VDILGIRYWVLGIGYWVLGIGYWVLGIGDVVRQVELRMAELRMA
jgi:hypothetical protein